MHDHHECNDSDRWDKKYEGKIQFAWTSNNTQQIIATYYRNNIIIMIIT